jgi:hypothetical protein
MISCGFLVLSFFFAPLWLVTDSIIIRARSYQYLRLTRIASFIYETLPGMALGSSVPSTEDDCLVILLLQYISRRRPIHSAFTWIGGLRTSALLGELMYSILKLRMLIRFFIVSDSYTFSWSISSRWSGWRTGTQAAYGCRKGKVTGSSEIGLCKPTVFQDTFSVARSYLWALEIK